MINDNFKKKATAIVGPPRLPFSAKSEFGKRKEAAGLSTEKGKLTLICSFVQQQQQLENNFDLAAV